MTFTDASAVDTTADFSETGTYVLQLTADDSELNTSSTVTITVEDSVTTTITLTSIGSEDGRVRESF